jgi:hypothetical protein
MTPTASSVGGASSSLLTAAIPSVRSTSTLNATVGSPAPDGTAYVEPVVAGDGIYSWQLVPGGLMYRSYLAGPREPRLASVWMHTRDDGWIWEPVLGGRAGLVRYGTDDVFRPEGYQVDIEGAVFPRLDQGGEVVSNDYRFGVPLTMRRGPWEAKFGYYHFCSHLGDEYMIKNPLSYLTRLNYVRNSLVLGVGYYLTPSIRVYSEADYAFQTDDGARPWEFQFGAELSDPGPTGAWGAPFVAVNGHLRQVNNYGGSVNAQAGWQWRGRTGHLCRIGAQYFNGMCEQGEFYNRAEQQIGAGIWYDF